MMMTRWSKYFVFIDFDTTTEISLNNLTAGFSGVKGRVRGMCETDECVACASEELPFSCLTKIGMDLGLGVGN